MEVSDYNSAQTVAEWLKRGEVCIVPSDTVYVLVCAISQRKAIEKMAQLKGVRLDNARFSIVCADLSNLAQYSKPIPTPYYRALKKHTPGVFTFILEANNAVPKLFVSRRTAIGLRVPESQFLRDLAAACGEPLVVSSLHSKANPDEFPLTAHEAEDEWGNDVYQVVDGGKLSGELSTVVDLTHSTPIIVRQGGGDWNP